MLFKNPNQARNPAISKQKDAETITTEIAAGNLTLSYETLKMLPLRLAIRQSNLLSVILLDVPARAIKKEIQVRKTEKKERKLSPPPK